MAQTESENFVAFAGSTRIASGSLADVARAVKTACDSGQARLLAFDDATGRLVEFDLRGSLDEVLARLPPGPGVQVSKPATRGRPRLGVTAREVTLLPRHWEWLANQPGGASAALRRLIDQARGSRTDRARMAQDAAYRVMVALAGDAPDFEEATRAFYAKDYDRFDTIAAAWPEDVRDYVGALVSRVAALETPA